MYNAKQGRSERYGKCDIDSDSIDHRGLFNFDFVGRLFFAVFPFPFASEILIGDFYINRRWRIGRWRGIRESWRHRWWEMNIAEVRWSIGDIEIKYLPLLVQWCYGTTARLG